MINKNFKQFFLFCMNGVVNTLVNFTVFIIALKVFVLPALIAGGLGFFSGALVGYTLNRRFTFKSTVKYSKGAALYFSVQLFCLTIHLSVMYFCINVSLLTPIVAQIVGIAVTTFLNFFLVRLLVFGGH